MYLKEFETLFALLSVEKQKDVIRYLKTLPFLQQPKSEDVSLPAPAVPEGVD